MLLLYANDMFFANILEDTHKLMKALEEFCICTKLSVISFIMKIMLVKGQNKDNPCAIYDIEPLETMESFKYLGLKVPSNHRWNECATLFKGKKETLLCL